MNYVRSRHLARLCPQYLDGGLQEYYIPPPHTAQIALRDAISEEASQHQQQEQQEQQSAITFTRHHLAAAKAQEEGPIGWVPPEERGFQHQSASNEVRIAYPSVDRRDQQPQFAPTFQG